MKKNKTAELVSKPQENAKKYTNHFYDVKSFPDGVPNHKVEDSAQQEEWEKEFDKEDFYIGTTMDGDTLEINYPKLKSFISSLLASEKAKWQKESNKEWEKIKFLTIKQTREILIEELLSKFNALNTYKLEELDGFQIELRDAIKIIQEL